MALDLYKTFSGFGTTNPGAGASTIGGGAWTPSLDTGSAAGALSTFTDPTVTATQTATSLPDTTSIIPTPGAWGDRGVNTGGGGKGPGGSKSGFGWNAGTMDLVLGGIQTIAGIWQAWEQNKIQKKQLEMQRNLANINIGNQSAAYNRVLGDVVNNRVESGGWDKARGDAYLAENRLKTQTV